MSSTKLLSANEIATALGCPENLFDAVAAALLEWSTQESRDEDFWHGNAEVDVNIFWGDNESGNDTHWQLTAYAMVDGKTDTQTVLWHESLAQFFDTEPGPEMPRIESREGGWYAVWSDNELPLQATEDGFLVDEWGEVYGSVDATPEDQDAAVQSYLKRRAWGTAKLEGLRHEMNLLIAGVTERFETRIREQERKIKWLDMCFQSMAEQWATTKIAHQGKGKSFKTDWATVGFTASRETLKVVDPVKAMAYLTDPNTDRPIVYAPLRLTFDLSAIDDRDGSPDQANLVVIAEDLLRRNAGVKVEVLPSKLPVGIDRSTLPTEAFEHKPAGSEQAFYIKHDAKAGE